MDGEPLITSGGQGKKDSFLLGWIVYLRENHVAIPLINRIGSNMNDLRQRKGNHTWDIIIHYERCPLCGYIIENREKFECYGSILEKDFTCPRCQQKFTVTKKG